MTIEDNLIYIPNDDKQKQINGKNYQFIGHCLIPLDPCNT